MIARTPLRLAVPVLLVLAGVLPIASGLAQPPTPEAPAVPAGEPGAGDPDAGDAPAGPSEAPGAGDDPETPAAPSLPEDFVAARAAMIETADRAAWGEFLTRFADPDALGRRAAAGLTTAQVVANLAETGRGKALLTALQESRTMTPVVGDEGRSITYTFVPDPNSGEFRPPLVFVRREGRWVLRG